MSNEKIFSILLITFVFINSIQAVSILSDPLTSVRTGIESTIDSGIDQLTKNLNEANNQVSNISQRLIKASEEIAQLIHNQVLGLLKKLDDEVNKLIDFDRINSDKNKAHIDFTGCKQISEKMILLASVAYSNYSYCVVEKIELADGYGESIRKITNDVIANLSMIKNDVDHCSDNLDSGVRSKTKAILCLKNVGARGTWITLNSIPDVVTNITNLISQMTGLQITLPQCAVTHGIDDLSQKYMAVYNETKNCVDAKKNLQKKSNDL